jgi:hypothetical protein
MRTEAIRNFVGRKLGTVKIASNRAGYKFAARKAVTSGERQSLDSSAAEEAAREQARMDKINLDIRQKGNTPPLFDTTSMDKSWKSQSDRQLEEGRPEMLEDYSPAQIKKELDWEKTPIMSPLGATLSMGGLGAGLGAGIGALSGMGDKEKMLKRILIGAAIGGIAGGGLGYANRNALPSEFARHNKQFD